MTDDKCDYTTSIAIRELVIEKRAEQMSVNIIDTCIDKARRLQAFYRVNHIIETRRLYSKAYVRENEIFNRVQIPQKMYTCNIM